MGSASGYDEFPGDEPEDEDGFDDEEDGPDAEEDDGDELLADDEDSEV